MSGEGTSVDVLAGSARWSLTIADCRAWLATLPSDSLDSCVCDPPYELGFMGRKWDASGIAYDVSMWREVLRVLKPGAHLLAFGGTRTYHRMACAIEDAGFDVRDCIGWVFGQGFPKSLNVSEGLAVKRCRCDANESDLRDMQVGVHNPAHEEADSEVLLAAMLGGDAGGTPDANRSGAWPTCGRCNKPIVPDGIGTALKPAWESIVVARKPLIGTVAANVLEHGTGGMNIDGCRIGWASEDDKAAAAAAAQRLCQEPRHGHGVGDMGIHGENQSASLAPYLDSMTAGRWPANVIHDGSDEVLDAFDRFGERPSGVAVMRNGGGRRIWGSDNTTGAQADQGYFDSGTAARFFFCAKASRAERELGCDGIGFSKREDMTGRREGSAGQKHARSGVSRIGAFRNVHPTVKPLALMRYLCRLVTPPGGVVLDQFTGSGTCGMAALLESFRYLGCELEEAHGAIARARIGHPLRVELEEQTSPTGSAQMALFAKVDT